MLTIITVGKLEEIQKENEYYRPYYELLSKIDAFSGMKSPPLKEYPPVLESLDEVAIDVIGNIQNQLGCLERESKRITIDLWESISEILGYRCDLEDGNLLTKAIYLISIEVTELLQSCRRKQKKYYDIWYVNDNGHVCIDITKALPPAIQTDLYTTTSRWFASDHNVNFYCKHLPSYVTSAMEDCVDISFYIQEKAFCPIEISLLLLQSKETLNLDHTITHGFSLIYYFRLLQLYFYQQITACEKPCLLETTRWFVDVDKENDEVELYLSFDPEE